MQKKQKYLQISILTILILCGIAFAYMWCGEIGTPPDDRVVQEKVHAYYELWNYEESTDS